MALTQRYVPAAPGRAAAAVTRKAAEPLPYDVWVLLLYGLVAGAALQATNVYLPLFAFEQVSFSAATAG